MWGRDGRDVRRAKRVAKKEVFMTVDRHGEGVGCRRHYVRKYRPWTSTSHRTPLLARSHAANTHYRFPNRLTPGIIKTLSSPCPSSLTLQNLKMLHLFAAFSSLPLTSPLISVLASYLLLPPSTKVRCDIVKEGLR